MLPCSRLMDIPSKVASPDDGFTAPVSMLNVVDLPAPLVPRKPKHSPSRMRSETSLTATLPPRPL
eukprot:scaffold229164_cov27-Tisochrysis_lutea.AAC.1